MSRSMSLRILLVAVAVSIGCSSCARPSQTECEQACLHHARLWIEEQWAEKIRTAAASERADLIAKKNAEWDAIERDPEAKGRHQCVDSCTKRGRPHQVQCINEAQTFAVAVACWDD